MQPSTMRSVFSRLLGSNVTSVKRVRSGRNSQLYRLTCEDSGVYAAKLYFRHSLDDRDRLDVEFSSLQFLWENGVRCIPRPVTLDRANGCAVYEYVNGREISSEEVNNADIDYAVDFLATLRQIKSMKGSSSLPPASEACFSVEAIVDNIARRLDRLLTLQTDEEPYQALREFLTKDFVPSFDDLKGWCRSSLNRLGMSFDVELPYVERTLSPSDFGFHNALRSADGRIIFLDFEYFGWDDPAKMISDFLLHPAMRLRETLKQRFVSGILARFKHNHFLDNRVRITYPLFGLKWCLILLNEFIPELLARREFASQKEFNKGELQVAQLAKARRMLHRVMNEYGRFPIMPKRTVLNSPNLDTRSIDLRRTVIRVLATGKRGHLGAAFSLVEILRVLYDDVLHYDPKNPGWENRDRCILSKGHGCLALYVILAEKGFFPSSELGKFCKSDGILGGHPEYGKIPGIEASTGSLGHGLSIGVGFALNARYERADYRTFVIIGDGESDEGSVWEAAMCASKHQLSNLTVIVDYNKQQSCDTTFKVQDLEPFAEKWKSFGCAVAEVDGHNVDELKSVLSNLPLEPDRPSVIICHTVKGKGIGFAENNLNWHHKSRITDEEIRSLLAALGESD